MKLISTEVTVHVMARTKKPHQKQLSHLSVFMFRCSSAHSNFLWCQKLSVLHTSQKEVLSCKKTKQTFLSSSERSWAYIFTPLPPWAHLQRAKHIAMSDLYTYQTCLHHQKPTCKAVGQHWLQVHRLARPFSPKQRLTHMWMQGLSGRQGSNTELTFGVLFWVPSPLLDKLHQWCTELIWGFSTKINYLVHRPRSRMFSSCIQNGLVAVTCMEAHSS